MFPPCWTCCTPTPTSSLPACATCRSARIFWGVPGGTLCAGAHRGEAIPRRWRKAARFCSSTAWPPAPGATPPRPRAMWRTERPGPGRHCQRRDRRPVRLAGAGAGREHRGRQHHPVYRDRARGPAAGARARPAAGAAVHRAARARPAGRRAGPHRRARVQYGVHQEPPLPHVPFEYYFYVQLVCPRSTRPKAAAPCWATCARPATRCARWGRLRWTPWKPNVQKRMCEP